MFDWVINTLQKEPPEEVHKKDAFKNFAHRKTHVPEVNFIKKKKEALAQVLSCEFCGIFKNTHF